METYDLPARERTADPAATPAIPLPNPGEGGAVFPDSGAQTPAIPLPGVGEGGAVFPGGGAQTPAVPLPSPGEGGAVYPGTGVQPLPGGQTLPGGLYPVYPSAAAVRFLNAAYGYAPFRIFIGNARIVPLLGAQSVSSYSRIPAGYRVVTVAGQDGYIYLQRTLLLEPSSRQTIAVVNRASGLDLVQIADPVSRPSGYNGSLRVANLASGSGALDVLLADGRVIYADVRFKEVTTFKRIAPGAYEFVFARTNLLPAPAYTDIETLDSAFIGMSPTADAVASLYLAVQAGSSYTVCLVSSGPARDAVAPLVIEDR
ncbi:MAG: DUF4397 domain-containing protein [Clostridia bacterium]|nr:DUF4397 domain-containing protein [Clostridia bacterium]